MAKAVLVSGSRDYPHPELVEKALLAIKENGGPFTLIHGDCPSGVDYIAHRYATDELELPVMPVPAQWTKLKKKAGPIRNQAMIQIISILRYHGWTIQVLAFPAKESKGTRDLIRQASAKGFEVEVTEA